MLLYRAESKEWILRIFPRKSERSSRDSRNSTTKDRRLKRPWEILRTRLRNKASLKKSLSLLRKRNKSKSKLTKQMRTYRKSLRTTNNIKNTTNKFTSKRTRESSCFLCKDNSKRSKEKKNKRFTDRKKKQSWLRKRRSKSDSFTKTKSPNVNKSFSSLRDTKWSIPKTSKKIKRKIKKRKSLRLTDCKFYPKKAQLKFNTKNPIWKTRSRTKTKPKKTQTEKSLFLCKFSRKCISWKSRLQSKRSK